MNWLLAHLRRRRRRIEETIEVATGDGAGAKPEPPECSRPRLALLVQDAAGPAAYQLHTFSEAAAAAAFIRFWFPPRFQHGIRAFWTSHEEPAWEVGSSEERQPEVVILIRDEDRRDIVYPFSCSDMGQARSWIAMEASRGLDLRLVLLYWAVQVRIEADGRGVERFSPSEPPMARRRNGHEAGFEAEPTLVEVEDRGVVSELIDFEAAEPVEDVRPDVPIAAAEPVEDVRPDVPIAAAEPVEDVRPDAPIAAAEAVEDVRPDAPIAAAEPVEDVRPDVPIAAAEPVEDVRPDVPTAVAEPVEDVRPDAPMAAAEPVEDVRPDAPMAAAEVDAELREAATTVAPQLIDGDGDQSQVREAEEMAEVSVEDRARGASFVEEDAPGAAEDGDAVEESGWGPDEISPEMASFLKMRRWRRPEGPFKGFGSPEGRF
jgi:hypothetical protein